jgi:hypothetical protein
VWVGVFGNQYQWDYFTKLWKEKLDNPPAGRKAIERFHMTECQRAGGQFSGWSRAEVDGFAGDLTEILLRTALWGFGSAVPKADWAELVNGDAAALHGDAEGRCIRTVYLHAVDWAERKVAGDNVSFVFDDRAQRVKENALLYEIFKWLHEDKSIKVRPDSLEFALSSTCLPLQAADLFAWETYRHAIDVVTNGRAPLRPSRKSLAKLLDRGRFSIGVPTRAIIEKMASISAPGAAESYKQLLDTIGKPSKAPAQT